MKDLIATTPENGFDVVLDIRYATKNNFTGELVYDKPYAFLHSKAAENLKKAINLATIQGLKFKIFDSFRPLSAQEFLFEKFPGGVFVSDPKTGEIAHCRGVAVDLTLVDKSGNELDMGTGFDDFTSAANHGSKLISDLAQKNRDILVKIMTDAGFEIYKPEWWHYQLPNVRSYPVIKML